jgi:hypothetical protein
MLKKSGAKAIAVLLLAAAIILNGCSDKKEKNSSGGSSDEPTKETAKAVSRDKTADSSKGKFAIEGMTSISDNPKFFQVKEVTPNGDIAKDIDMIMRPILKELFEEVKFVDSNNLPPYSEGMATGVKFVVRRLMDSSDAMRVHDAMRAAGATRSPRIGAKPLVMPKYAAMSLFKGSTNKSYHLCIYMDFVGQSIWVATFIPNAKADRIG